MRDRMERFVILPFSVGCVCESSVAVAVQQPKRSKPADTNSTAIRTRKEDEESLSSDQSMKHSLKLLPLPKPAISTGFHRLFKSFKTLSQFFAYKEEMEESEKDMQIGFPTDVKHVTHIGLDMGSWDNIPSPPRLFTFPMETQAEAGSPLVHASTKYKKA
ncbi:CRIB domain-containing protein RIC4-like [Durio zibethinus]|uniref:CRIB domain-containing protein RIC4-like n=1 Tax=Durio zibethinus TaxID=66656 RepID=A0A6P5Z4H9_DURZI|nr:CRIB domain-containing protein RIC4-like [Durio zibethinus]